MSKLGLPDNQHWSAKLQKCQRQIARVGEDGRASYCCDDGIDQIVNVKKPEEKHEGKVLQKKRAKWFAHVLHNIHQFLQIAIIGLPWWNIYSSLLLFSSGACMRCWQSSGRTLFILWSCKDTFGKRSIEGAEAVEDKLLISEEKVETKSWQKKDSEYAVDWKRLLLIVWHRHAIRS